MISYFVFICYGNHLDLSVLTHSFPTRRSSDLIRALNPVPGAFFEYHGERFRVHAAHIEHASGTPGELIDDSLLIACGKGAIRPTLIQRAGKAAMTAGELLRGYDMPEGTAVDAFIP